jgi:hypothetical protein
MEIISMRRYENIFLQLIDELFKDDEKEIIIEIYQSKKINQEKVMSFDKSLGGPSMLNQTRNGSSRYYIKDRDIFRPLQYCRSHFLMYFKEGEDECFSRDIIEMSCMHIEELIKRIGGLWRLPLGQAIHNAIVRSTVDPITWDQIKRFVYIYNDAKHYFSQEKDTHLFSMNEALISYFICRKIAEKLYPISHISTDPKIFEIPEN